MKCEIQAPTGAQVSRNPALLPEACRAAGAGVGGRGGGKKELI